MEEWKWIEGFEGLYKISSHGKVKSFIGKEKLLKDGKVQGGYRQVILKGKPFRIHRLVAKAFLPNIENKKEIDHIDNDPSNNRVENLEWVTRSQNIKRMHTRRWEHIL